MECGEPDWSRCPYGPHYATVREVMDAARAAGPVDPFTLVFPRRPKPLTSNVSTGMLAERIRNRCRARVDSWRDDGHVADLLTLLGFNPALTGDAWAFDAACGAMESPSGAAALPDALRVVREGAPSAPGPLDLALWESSMLVAEGAAGNASSLRTLSGYALGPLWIDDDAWVTRTIHERVDRHGLLNLEPRNGVEQFASVMLSRQVETGLESMRGNASSPRVRLLIDALIHVDMPLVTHWGADWSTPEAPGWCGAIIPNTDVAMMRLAAANPYGLLDTDETDALLTGASMSIGANGSVATALNRRPPVLRKAKPHATGRTRPAGRPMELRLGMGGNLWD
ncbi:hypothetical protein EMO89_00120 [Bifidobacterium tissieri]|uniref:Uncharacterized protein n=1 Tax=Bifidobacterium tissieri TaxID=1630162 RepID=A0A5M9ZX10_9BIFI|nr:hypothetical protein [Bifidobacterium tissieri]KAA8831969.1 hypothetical protein EMO89_00120 [Bifidobacterium tissieri]